MTRRPSAPWAPCSPLPAPPIPPGEAGYRPPRVDRDQTFLFPDRDDNPAPRPQQARLFTPAKETDR